MTNIPKATIRNIAKESGAERIADESVLYLQGKAADWISSQVKSANVLAQHAGRKTIKVDDFRASESIGN